MKNIVIAVHGFRTYGSWHAELKSAIDRKAHSIFECPSTYQFISYDYGFFGFPSFIYPPAKRTAVDAFKNSLLAYWDVENPPTIDIFAHSFGTYLVLHALAATDLPDNFKVRNVVFASSALPPNSFSKVFSRVKPRLRRLVNDCGTKDNALLATLPVYGTGMAGRLGLHGPKGSQFCNRYFAVGHSGYFQYPAKDPNSHISREWLPLLHDTSVVKLTDQRASPPSLTDRVISSLYEHGGQTAVIIYFGSL
ncbi:MAG: alpha/beta hydrolase, partial [Hyphomicrobiaceae bacterium]